MACKRGYGLCLSCKQEYCNRTKPQFCGCGVELGGSFTKRQKVASPPESVLVSQCEQSSFRSVKVTPNDDRQFVLITASDRICYVRKCLDLRATWNASGKLDNFLCSHIEVEPREPIYRVSFDDTEIENFTPDKIMQNEMKINQSLDTPTVVKVSQKSYAVAGPVSTTSALSYVHVKEEKGEGGRIKCTGTGCKSKIGRTKQAIQKKTCVHLHYVVLAKQLKEDVYIPLNKDNMEVGGKLQESSQANAETSKKMLPENAELAIKIQLMRRIPYYIPPSIVAKSDSLLLSESIPTYSPAETKCILCNFELGHAMFPQGCSSINGNGILITNKDPYTKINIMLKKCKSVSCGAINTLFPFNEGLFNSSNKVLIGLDILLEWREYLKEGVPISNMIKRKLNALLLKVDQVLHPSVDELNYLVEILYNGFYGFEALTVRDLNSVICGLCGIAGKVYYGDGNEKNCCTLKNIILEKKVNEEEVQNKDSNSIDKSDWLNSCMDTIKYNLVERSTFAKPKLSFKVRLEDIPPLIPSMMRDKELNTEIDKKSIYLKENDKDIEGDAMCLSKILRERGMSINDIDSMNIDSLIRFAKYCKINKTSSKSQ